MIVGIVGLSGSGKDTAADFLVKNHGFSKIALADPIKRVCMEVFGFTAEQLWGPSSARNAPDKRYPRSHEWTIADTCRRCDALNDNEPCYLTPRYALQQLGTEWGRNCYPNLWTEYALRTAKKLLEGPEYKANHYSPKLGLMFVGGLEKPKGVVISDVRFQNEMNAIRSAGGILIRLLRGHGLEGTAAQHTSETEQRSIPNEAFDCVLDNNEWSLEELEEAMCSLAQTDFTFRYGLKTGAFK
jgi:hypothetical protein